MSALIALKKTIIGIQSPGHVQSVLLQNTGMPKKGHALAALSITITTKQLKSVSAVPLG